MDRMLSGVCEAAARHSSRDMLPAALQVRLDAACAGCSLDARGKTLLDDQVPLPAFDDLCARCADAFAGSLPAFSIATAPPDFSRLSGGEEEGEGGDDDDGVVL